MYPGSELTFVNVQNPHDVVAPSLRHRIRSRAAFHTHECRLKTTLPLQLSQSVGQYNVLVPRYTPQKEAATNKHQQSSIRKRLRSASTVQQDEAEAAVRRDALENRLSTSFANAPVPSERWHADLLGIWNTDAYPKYWELTNIERMTGIKYDEYQSWMIRASMVDPTVYYTELLAGITNVYPNAGRGTRRRLYVETELCRAINNALDDPDRRLSTLTLIAVARFAFHECLLGNRDLAWKVHFPGLRRMMEMKGGEQGMRKDAPHMIVELFRVHAWMITEACELGKFGPFARDHEVSLHHNDTLGQSSHSSGDPDVKQEELGAGESAHSLSYDLLDTEISPTEDDSPRKFLRNVAWHPSEAKSPPQYQPYENTSRSFWTTTGLERDYPAHYATPRRLNALSQSADSVAV